MTRCEECDSEFKSVGLHWYHNPEHRPDISSEQYEILKGILMGDGYIDSSQQNPYLVLVSVEYEYLEYLSEVFGSLSGPIDLERTPNKHSQKYRWRTKTHPQMVSLSNWYQPEKRFPKSLQLTPRILKHWYCCDGCYKRESHIEIGLHNERDRREKINNFFDEAGLPEPTWESFNSSTKIRFTTSESNKIFDYMGACVPGFEYKWP